MVLLGEPTKRIRLSAKPISHNWEFGKEDIDELLFMLQVGLLKTQLRKCTSLFLHFVQMYYLVRIHLTPCVDHRV